MGLAEQYIALTEAGPEEKWVKHIFKFISSKVSNKKYNVDYQSVGFTLRRQGVDNWDGDFVNYKEKAKAHPDENQNWYATIHRKKGDDYGIVGTIDITINGSDVNIRIQKEESSETFQTGKFDLKVDR